MCEREGLYFYLNFDYIYASFIVFINNNVERYSLGNTNAGDPAPNHGGGSRGLDSLAMQRQGLFLGLDSSMATNGSTFSPEHRYTYS